MKRVLVPCTRDKGNQLMLRSCNAKEHSLSKQTHGQVLISGMESSLNKCLQLSSYTSKTLAVHQNVKHSRINVTTVYKLVGSSVYTEALPETSSL